MIMHGPSSKRQNELYKSQHLVDTLYNEGYPE